MTARGGLPDGMERVRFQQFMTWAGQVVMLLHFSSIPLLAQRVGWRVMPRWYAAQSLAMAGVWHAFAADTPAQWRGPVPMSAEALELLDSIGRENLQDEPPARQQPTGAAEPPDAELCDKNLPPLSMGQLFRIREIQGMLTMCVVECTFPTFTKVQALWTLYFVERYGMPMEQVLLRQTALMAPTAVVAALLEGVVETVLIKRGWSTIDIRRRSSSATRYSTARMSASRSAAACPQRPARAARQSRPRPQRSLAALLTRSPLPLAATEPWWPPSMTAPRPMLPSA